MRSSIIVGALCAGLAIASPLQHKHKRAIKVEMVTVTDIVTIMAEAAQTEAAPAAAVVTVSEPEVTVTEGASSVIPTSSWSSWSHHHHTHSTSEVPSSSIVEVPSSTEPAPTSTEAPSTTEVPTSTEAPSTTEAPTSTEAPSTTEIPSTTEAPSSTEALSTTEAATSTEEPIEKPASTEAAVASSTTEAASTASPTDYSSTAVYHHNIHRSNHSASAVTYNDTLASYAATVAASCVFAHNLTPGGGGYGQNIASYGATGDVESLGASAMVAGSITDMWYNGEINSYLPSYYGESTPDMSNFDAWGHFSQVVWAGSDTVGCASQYCAANTMFSGMASWFTVCNYGPAGNMGGEYGTNVLEPLGQPSVTA